MEPYANLGYCCILPNPYLFIIHNVEISRDAATFLPLQQCL
jgi:hypothetical protein